VSLGINTQGMSEAGVLWSIVGMLSFVIEQRVKPGEWCRAVVLEGTREKEAAVSRFEQMLLEEFTALRSIVSSVIYDLATESSLSVERMDQIIAHADQVKFERAGKIIEQVLKRESNIHE
jgi:hypothetical protein